MKKRILTLFLMCTILCEALGCGKKSTIVSGVSVIDLPFGEIDFADSYETIVKKLGEPDHVEKAENGAITCVYQTAMFGSDCFLQVKMSELLYNIWYRISAPDELDKILSGRIVNALSETFGPPLITDILEYTKLMKFYSGTWYWKIGDVEICMTCCLHEINIYIDNIYMGKYLGHEENMVQRYGENYEGTYIYENEDDL